MQRLSFSITFVSLGSPVHYDSNMQEGGFSRVFCFVFFSRGLVALNSRMHEIWTSRFQLGSGGNLPGCLL